MRVLDVVWLALLHTWRLLLIIAGTGLVTLIGLQIWFSLETRAREKRAQRKWRMRRYRVK